jgi:hypothetical protein
MPIDQTTLERLKDFDLTGGIEAHGRFSTSLMVLTKLSPAIPHEEMNFIRDHVEQIVNKLTEMQSKKDPQLQLDAATERATLLGFFHGKAIRAQETTNPYHARSPFGWMHPHFLVTTEIGVISIHRRKRVYSIDYSNTDVKEDSQTLFPDEDVTKEGKLIHAWTTEKAQAYINKLFEVAQPQK